MIAILKACTGHLSASPHAGQPLPVGCSTVLSSCGKQVSVLATQSSNNLQLETACRSSLQWDYGRLRGQADLNICSSQPDAWPGRTETNAAAHSRSHRSKQGRDGACACRVDQQICGCVRCTEIAAWLVFKATHQDCLSDSIFRRQAL